MMARFRTFTPVLLLAFAAPAFAADANSFTLVKDGKPIGKASYTISKTKDGYKVRDHFEYHLAVVSNSPSEIPGQKSASQFTVEYSTQADGSFITGYTQNAANQMIVSYQSTKARDAVVVSKMQGGLSSSGNPLPMPVPNFFFAPDYDPSGIQLLIIAAMEHPHADFKYVLLTPGPGARPINTITYIAMNQADDRSIGLLDGKEIALKHFQVNYSKGMAVHYNLTQDIESKEVVASAKGKADFYTDADGNLMQADLAPLSTSYIRAKFVLAGK